MALSALCIVASRPSKPHILSKLIDVFALLRLPHGKLVMQLFRTLHKLADTHGIVVFFVYFFQLIDVCEHPTVNCMEPSLKKF